MNAPRIGFARTGAASVRIREATAVAATVARNSRRVVRTDMSLLNYGVVISLDSLTVNKKPQTCRLSMV
jgi:hypothetical protein